MVSLSLPPCTSLPRAACPKHHLPHTPKSYPCARGTCTVLTPPLGSQALPLGHELPRATCGPWNALCCSPASQRRAHPDTPCWPLRLFSGISCSTASGSLPEAFPPDDGDGAGGGETSTHSSERASTKWHAALMQLQQGRHTRKASQRKALSRWTQVTGGSEEGTVHREDFSTILNSPEGLSSQPRSAAKGQAGAVVPVFSRCRLGHKQTQELTLLAPQRGPGLSMQASGGTLSS